MSSSSSYGITERAGRTSASEHHAERVRLVGSTIIASELAQADLDDLAARLDALAERQSAAAGGRDRLAEIGEQETVRACLAHDDAFLQLATNARVLEVCRLLLGEYFILMQQNGIINAPRRAHTQTAYHRDLPYQHFVSSRPLAVSALFCIDPFVAANGATLVLPASHKIEQFPSDDVVRELEQPVEAPPGSFIVFDSMLFHRAGHNAMTTPRRAVNHVFTLPFIAQQISFPAMLAGRFSDNPEVARLLGYGAGPAMSLDEWWARRRPVGSPSMYSKKP